MVKRGKLVIVTFLLGVLALIGALSFILAQAPPVSAEPSLYADVFVDVYETGQISIGGTTNHPILAPGVTEAFTSKKGIYWLLNISPEGEFSDYVFTIRLPRDAVINYLRTPSQVRISEDNGRITLTGTGHNEPFYVEVQYSYSTLIQKFNYALYVIIGLASLLIAVTLVYFLAKRKKRGNKTQNINKALLTERQRQILNYIVKSDKLVTQALLEKETGLPKSSLSRNIDSLVRKGILKKEQRGMSNVISLNPGDEPTGKQKQA